MPTTRDRQATPRRRRGFRVGQKIRTEIGSIWTILNIQPSGLIHLLGFCDQHIVCGQHDLSKAIRTRDFDSLRFS